MGTFYGDYYQMYLGFSLGLVLWLRLLKAVMLFNDTVVMTLCIKLH